VTERHGDAATTPVSHLVNVAACLTERARESPSRVALILAARSRSSGARELTYEELDRESDTLARGLASASIGRGVRTALMVRPGRDFFALVFAIAKVGAVPVIVDPGMGLGNVGKCLAQAAPAAFIGIPLAHAARVAMGWGKGTLRSLVTVGGPALFGGRSLGDLKRAGASPASSPPSPFQIAETREDEIAAILFTSGSTGPPKGVVYTHGNFAAQIDALRVISPTRPAEKALATFPLFALFDPALGMTTIVPDMDPARPARVDPAKIVGPILEHGVTTMFASPAVLARVARYGSARGVRLPTLTRVISAGAPVDGAVIAQFLSMLGEGAQVFTPYGATEALPVTSIASGELLSPDVVAETARGAGVCVGRPVPPMRVAVIPIGEAPIAKWTDTVALPQGTIGEIAVSGPVVTNAYFEAGAATAQAKIDDQGEVVHRMGDVGFFDAEGRLWFCGRKAHRVVTADGTLFSVPCETIFNAHPDVFRTALVGVRSGALERETPVLCVELEPRLERARSATRDRIVRELLALGQRVPQTRGITSVLFHPGFPVDERHNSKIVREKLAAWAEAELR
jgi:acyl-CoA synthetase (AMP-forming)/AMP-acid ligase II